jgi:hypothetical protein
MQDERGSSFFRSSSNSQIHLFLIQPTGFCIVMWLQRYVRVREQHPEDAVVGGLHAYLLTCQAARSSHIFVAKPKPLAMSA